MKVLVSEDIMDGVWIDGFDWAGIIAAGQPVERAVACNAEAQVEADRGVHSCGSYPSYDARRCMRIAHRVTLAMRIDHDWTVERVREMRHLWIKTYRDEYARRESLDAFLRRVGQI